MVESKDGRYAIDGERILAEAREIAFPRYPGTEGNTRAREIVVRRFREAGLEVTEQPFSYDIRVAFRAIRAVLIGAALLLLAAAALAPASVALAAGVLVLGILLAGVMLVWAPGAERLYRRAGPTRTANVEARRSVKAPRLTLICLAHYDSKSQNLSFPYRMGFTLLAILGGLTLVALVVAGLLLGATPGPTWLPLLPGGVAALALFALSTLSNGNASPGGVDNAGSVAMLFELARSLPAELPDDVELILLSPSAEEDHMIGAMRWLDAHRGELASRQVYALNFDGGGAPGRPVMIESYGVWLPPAMGVDAIPFVHRGIECVTLSSGSLGRATVAVHSAGDVAENLDAATLAEVCALGRTAAIELARPDSPG
jgi:hypothetical protein